MKSIKIVLFGAAIVLLGSLAFGSFVSRGGGSNIPPQVADLTACGLTVTVKTGQEVKQGTSTDEYWMQVFSKESDLPILTVSCTKASSSGALGGMDISRTIAIDQKAAPEIADKGQYGAFDARTKAVISALYSEQRETPESGLILGFENNSWKYEFSFTDPKQALDQRAFVFSM